MKPFLQRERACWAFLKWRRCRASPHPLNVGSKCKSGQKIDRKQVRCVLDSCFLSGSACAGKASFVVGETRLSHPTDPPFRGSDMKQLQFHCEVSRKDRSWAIEDKAERGLAPPPHLSARALRNTQLNQTRHTTKHSPGEKAGGPKQLARAPGGPGWEESSPCLC